MIEIVTDQIDTNRLLASVQSDRAGAAVMFVGTTRQFTAGRETERLDYECYSAMAIKKMESLKSTAMKRWPIEKCSIVHRIGEVPVGEASVAIAVSTPHRGDSFVSAEWLIDTLKKEVPIWKKENFTDGSKEWIHPDSEVVSGENECSANESSDKGMSEIDSSENSTAVSKEIDAS